MSNTRVADAEGKTEMSVDGCSKSEASNLPLFSAASEFSALCKKLSVPQDIIKKAEGTLGSIMSVIDRQEEIEMSQREMFGCALYMSLIDSRMPYGPHDPQLRQGHLATPSLSVSQLLQITQISVKQLVEKMRQVKELMLLSDAVSYHLTLLEKAFCIMCYLSHTFDRLCTGVFREEDRPHMEANEENIVPSLPETEGVTFRKKLCWLLFLHAKQRIMGDNLDLLNGFLFLLCCLEYVMRSTPSFLLNSPYDVMRIGCQNMAGYGSKPMLSKMCEQFEANREDAESLSHAYLEPLFSELVNAEGELDPDELEEGYLRLHANEGDLNELLFFSKDPLYSPSSSTHMQSNGSTSLHTSGNDADPMTPVRATLSSVQQLKAWLASATEQPSHKLITYFEICTHDPRAAIEERLRQCKIQFMERFHCVMPAQKSVAEARFSLGVRLYYTMLELLLNNDIKKVPVSVLDALLNKEDFHKSLAAGCLEVVLVTYGLTRSYAVNCIETEGSPLAFPWILETLNIQAYDFFKVVESLIRAEPRLPTDVVKHLQNVEYKILECLAWKEGSSLFDVIRVCERGVNTSPKNSPTELFSNIEHHQMCPSAAQLYLSPLPGLQTSHQSPQTSHQSLQTSHQSLQPHQSLQTSHQSLQPHPCATSPNAVLRRSQSLSSFFNKVYRLAHFRLQKLCSPLGINKDLLHKIWTCFENCVTYRPEILKNRHLDQILMCSIYGICRVVEREIKFKMIIREYSQVFPTAQQQVYRNVYMGSDRSDSIISFYNQIFMVSMKSCLLQFSTSSNRQAVPRLSPVPTPNSTSPASPAKYSMPVKKNFMVSPLKESPFKTPQSPSQLTPSRHQLYCFGDRPGSAEKFRSINASVSLSAAKKNKLDFTTSEEPKEKVKRSIKFTITSSDDVQPMTETPIITPRKTSENFPCVGSSSKN